MYQLVWMDYDSDCRGAVVGDLESCIQVFTGYLSGRKLDVLELWQLGPPTCLVEKDGRSFPWWK